MTIRKVLLLPLLISMALFVYFSPEIINTVNLVTAQLTITPLFVSLILLSVSFLFFGHYLRSKKASLLMSPIEVSKTKTQFRAFSVGQLFNNLLPLKLGEIIRAGILAQKMNISFIYSFALIVFERLIDVSVVIVGALIVASIAGVLSAPLLQIIGIITALAIVGFIGVYIITRQPVWFLKTVHASSAVLNDGIRDRVRFKVWSLGYGLSKSLALKNLKLYGLYTLAMWAFYLVATLLIAIAVFPSLTQLSDYIVAAVAPYFGISVPSGPASLGSFSKLVDIFTANSGGVAGLAVVFNIVAWVVMIVPISVVGIVLLFTKTLEPIWSRRPTTVSDASLENKLSRSEDVSGELSTFLDNYFVGNDLSRIVNRLENNGDFSLVKYFKGGSDAITILALQNGKRVVKKIIPIQFKDRLKAQYDWLKKYGGRFSIVSTKNERTESDYYSIDITYDESSVPLFEYVHEIAREDAEGLLDQAWEALASGVYGKVGKLKTDYAAADEYVDRHIYQCLDKAMAVDGELKKATLEKKLIVNGKSYDNLHQILQKIKKHPQAWKDLATYQPSEAVHGDAIIDNLLYSTRTKKIIVIDPAPDGNIFNGPVFDFGKAIQSIHCGYEFLLRDESAVTLEDSNVISFKETKSTRYTELDEYVQGHLMKKYLTESEQRAALFHGGTLFLRRLKHQVYYTPENVLKFYAVGVRTLNEFLAQYQNGR